MRCGGFRMRSLNAHSRWGWFAAAVFAAGFGAGCAGMEEEFATGGEEDISIYDGKTDTLYGRRLNWRASECRDLTTGNYYSQPVNPGQFPPGYGPPGFQGPGVNPYPQPGFYGPGGVQPQPNMYMGQPNGVPPAPSAT